MAPIETLDQLVEGDFRKERTPSADEILYITGDIGASHSRLAVTTISQDKAQVLFEIEYSTSLLEGSKFGFTDIFEHFIENAVDYLGKKEFKAAVFSPAGPIIDGRRVTLSQRDVTVDLESIEKALRKISGVSVQAYNINDFAAKGYALPGINLSDKAQAVKIAGDEKRFYEIFGCLGAGSGLGGVSTVSRDGKILDVRQCEGGHIAAALPDDHVIQFIGQNILNFITLYKKQDYLEAEDLVSGRGIWNIFSAYRNILKTPEEYLFMPGANLGQKSIEAIIKVKQQLQQDYLAKKDNYDALFEEVDKNEGNFSKIAKLVGESVPQDLLLVENAMGLFFNMYGRATRDTIQAQGCEVFIECGGIMKHYLGEESTRFREQFLDGLYKNPVNIEYTRNVPIYVSLDNDISLKGCTYAAVSLSN